MPQRGTSKPPSDYVIYTVGSIIAIAALLAAAMAMATGNARFQRAGKRKRVLSHDDDDDDDDDNMTLCVVFGRDAWSPGRMLCMPVANVAPCVRAHQSPWLCPCRCACCLVVMVGCGQV